MVVWGTNCFMLIKTSSYIGILNSRIVYRWRPHIRKYINTPDPESSLSLLSEWEIR